MESADSSESVTSLEVVIPAEAVTPPEVVLSPKRRSPRHAIREIAESVVMAVVLYAIISTLLMVRAFLADF